MNTCDDSLFYGGAVGEEPPKRIVVQRRGKWLHEGFIAWFADCLHDLRREHDNLPECLPPEFFDVEWLADVMGLDATTFAGYRPKTTSLNDLEQQIISALMKMPMTGEQLAAAIGRYYDGHLKGTLASLKKRHLIGNRRPIGYYVVSKVRTDTVARDR